MSAGAFANRINSSFDRRNCSELHNYRYASGPVRVVLNATIMCVVHLYFSLVWEPVHIKKNWIEVNLGKLCRN